MLLLTMAFCFAVNSALFFQMNSYVLPLYEWIYIKAQMFWCGINVERTRSSRLCLASGGWLQRHIYRSISLSRAVWKSLHCEQSVNNNKRTEQCRTISHNELFLAVFLRVCTKNQINSLYKCKLLYHSLDLLCGEFLARDPEDSFIGISPNNS